MEARISLPPGEYLLRSTKDGRTVAEKAVTLTAGKTVDVDLRGK